MAAAALAVACGGGGVSTPDAPPDAPFAGGWAPSELLTSGTLRRDLYDGRYPPTVDVAFDASGRGWAVWATHEPPRVEGRRFDGGWGPVVGLHDATLPLDGFVGRDAFDAGLAMNRAGETLVGWRESHGNWVAMAKRGTTSAWEAAVRVQDEPSGAYGTRGRGIAVVGGPLERIDEAGNAWLLWSRAPGSVYPQGPAPSKLVASWRPRGGEWSAEVTVVADTEYEGYSGAAVLPGGELLVVWPSRGTLRAARLSPNRNWIYGVLADGGVARDEPALAPLADGRVLVSWSAPAPTIAVVDRDLARDAGTVLSPAAARPAAIAVSASGAVFAAWLQDWTIRARRADSIGAPFAPAVDVATVTAQASTRNAPRGLGLAADDAGNAFVTWIDGDYDPPARVAAARFTGAGGWGANATVSRGPAATSLSAPRVAVEAAGNAVIAFGAAPTSTTFEVRAARFAAR